MTKIKHELQKQEFVGDALLSAVVREYVYLWFEFKKERATNSNLCSSICSNRNLIDVAKRLGIEPFEPEPQGSISEKRLANAVEITIYRLYEAHGYEYIKKWVNDNIIIPYDDTWYKNRLIEIRNTKNI